METAFIQDQETLERKHAELEQITKNAEQGGQHLETNFKRYTHWYSYKHRTTLEEQPKLKTEFKFEFMSKFFQPSLYNTTHNSRIHS